MRALGFLVVFSLCAFYAQSAPLFFGGHGGSANGHASASAHGSGGASGLSSIAAIPISIAKQLVQAHQKRFNGHIKQFTGFLSNFGGNSQSHASGGSSNGNGNGHTTINGGTDKFGPDVTPIEFGHTGVAETDTSSFGSSGIDHTGTSGFEASFSSGSESSSFAETGSSFEAGGQSDKVDVPPPTGEVDHSFGGEQSISNGNSLSGHGSNGFSSHGSNGFSSHGSNGFSSHGSNGGFVSGSGGYRGGSSHTGSTGYSNGNHQTYYPQPSPNTNYKTNPTVVHLYQFESNGHGNGHSNGNSYTPPEENIDVRVSSSDVQPGDFQVLQQPIATPSRTYGPPDYQPPAPVKTYLPANRRYRIKKRY